MSKISSSLTSNYSSIETFDTLYNLAARAKQERGFQITLKRNELILIHLGDESGQHSIKHHMSIFRDSWNGFIIVHGKKAGPYSLHLTDERTTGTGRHVYYQAYPRLMSIQNASMSTISVPWRAENPIESVLYMVLGVQWRVAEQNI